METRIHSGNWYPPIGAGDDAPFLHFEKDFLAVTHPDQDEIRVRRDKQRRGLPESVLKKAEPPRGCWPWSFPHAPRRPRRRWRRPGRSS